MFPLFLLVILLLIWIYLLQLLHAHLLLLLSYSLGSLYPSSFDSKLGGGFEFLSDEFILKLHVDVLELVVHILILHIGIHNPGGLFVVLILLVNYILLLLELSVSLSLLLLDLLSSQLHSDVFPFQNLLHLPLILLLQYLFLLLLQCQLLDYSFSVGKRWIYLVFAVILSKQIISYHVVGGCGYIRKRSFGNDVLDQSLLKVKVYRLALNDLE